MRWNVRLALRERDGNLRLAAEGRLSQSEADVVRKLDRGTT